MTALINLIRQLMRTVGLGHLPQGGSSEKRNRLCTMSGTRERFCRLILETRYLLLLTQTKHAIVALGEFSVHSLFIYLFV